MRAPTRLQNSKSLNKKEGKKEWEQRHLDESRKRHKKKRRIHDKYMGKQDGRNKATLISDQNKYERIKFYYQKFKTLNDQ